MDIKDLKRCTARKKDGEQCMGTVLSGREYCFFHQPDKTITRRAQIKGGRAGKRLPKEILKIKCMKDVQQILDDTINEVRNTKGSALAKARVIGFLISIVMRYFEVRGEVLDKKIEEKEMGWFEESYKAFPAEVRERLNQTIFDLKAGFIVSIATEVQKEQAKLRLADQECAGSTETIVKPPPTVEEPTPDAEGQSPDAEERRIYRSIVR